jgi:UPF0716 protein FxsA
MTTPAPAPRSRARTILPLAVAAWALLEIWLLTVVARAAGGFTVVLLLVAGFVLGGLAVRRAGRSAWRSLAAAVQPGQGSQPAEGEKESRGAGVAMLGGLLLMIPGFVSDAVGLLCLFPPTRALLRKAFGLDRRATLIDQRIRIHRPDGKVIQGEVVEKDGVVIEQDNENPGSRR